MTEASHMAMKKPIAAASIEKNTSSTRGSTCARTYRLCRTSDCFRKERLLRREDHFGPCGLAAQEFEPAVQLVPDERPHDGEAGAVGPLVASGAGVRDRQENVPVPPSELDADVFAAVLERVLQELAEDERQRRRP